MKNKAILRSGFLLMSVILFAAPLFAQADAGANGADGWENFIDWLKKLIPGEFDDPLLNELKKNPGLMVELLVAIPIVVGAALLLNLGIKWLIKLAASRSSRSRVRWLRLYPILRLAVWIAATVTLLQIFLHEYWPFLILIFLLLVGYASKDGIRDLVGGLWLTIERPFSVGDRISTNGYYGEVKSIGLRAVTINTLDDSMVAISNGMILSEGLANANSGAPDCMVVTSLWLPVDIDVAKVRKAAYEAAVSSPYINLEKEVLVLFFDHFQERPATQVKVKAYVFDARYEKLFESDVTEAAKQAFRRERLY